ncbi:lipoate--protein ligase [soil metagenome]
MLFIDNKNITDAALNLAIEEYCVRNLYMGNDMVMQDYLLFYINSPSIIIGKHQNTIEEINSPYVKEKKITVVRRISGGGAVYHDEGNLNFSFMTQYSHDSIHNFKKFTQPVIEYLNELGINAELNGRNDITVDGKKISGNAQFSNTRSMFSHGTLLFDSNLENVVDALNVKQEKIESKGIKSIRSRVVNIKELLGNDMTIQDFREGLLNKIYESSNEIQRYDLTDEEWKGIEKLSNEKYRNWEWNYGRSPEFNIQKEKRFDFGKIDARICVSKGLIEYIKFYGDFLTFGELGDIEEKFKNVKYEETEVLKALEEMDLPNYFGTISKKDFADFLLV